VSHAEDALIDSGLPAASLVLELTETVLVEDPITVAGRLRQLQRLGVRLAIDDFGSGFSSLSYLRQFPVDILKIDRSFVSTMNDAEGVPALVHGLLDLGHTMRLEMVAEGIETSVQLAHLRAQRCQLGQGYLFSRPLPPEQAGVLLAGPGFAVSSGSNPLALAETAQN
jgi:EAL domain-containing protein (putative c-di-GMP-specific phosphodiesterase class I)